MTLVTALPRGLIVGGVGVVEVMVKESLLIGEVKKTIWEMTEEGGYITQRRAILPKKLISIC
jgi:hypothetical protein